MTLSVLCIGDELLKGFTVNTVQPQIGLALLELGVVADRVLTVKDEREALNSALEFLFNDSDVIITTGGLGPTADDISKVVVADYFGKALVPDQATIDKIRDFYRIRGIKRKPTEQVLSQALVPEGATILPNNVGTAPGIKIQDTVKGRMRTLFMLPGPPVESLPMLHESLIPELNELIDETLHTRVIHAAGIPESLAEERVQTVAAGVAGLSVAYCASPQVLKIFLSSMDPQVVENTYREIVPLIANNIICHGQALPEDVLGLLRENGMTLATAESCTGGMIAAALTDVPGSSDVFCGSVVTYSNDWKKSLLQVDDAILQTHGAVSEECVTQMVDHLCELYAVDAGIAVSGIAGPGGGSEEKPVGTVYIGVRYDGETEVIKRRYPGTRANVRSRTVASALNLLRSKIIQDPDAWF